MSKIPLRMGDSPLASDEEKINFYRTEMDYQKRNADGWRKIALRQQRELWVWHSLYGCPKSPVSIDNVNWKDDGESEPICDCGRVKGDSSQTDDFLTRHWSEIDYGS